MSNTDNTKNGRQCEICTTEIARDADVCPVCGAEVEKQESLSELIESEEITWTIVRVVSTVIEAELMAGRLRAHGIPAIVLSQVDTTRNFTVGELAVAKIFVPSVYAAKAERMLSVDADEWEEDDDDDHQESYDDDPVM